MKKRLSKKALISVCTLIAVLLVLIIWTIWGNTALMVSTVTVSSNRIPTAFNGFSNSSGIRLAQCGIRRK